MQTQIINFIVQILCTMHTVMLFELMKCVVRETGFLICKRNDDGVSLWENKIQFTEKEKWNSQRDFEQ